MKTIEKYYIKTDNPIYTIGNNKVTCTIGTFLKGKFNDGTSKALACYYGRGKSKCSPEDKFDLVKGIKIATARAENDYHKHFVKVLDKQIEGLGTEIDALYTLTDDCASQIAHNNAYVHSLIEPETDIE